MSTEDRLIKRYANRKLYDTVLRKFTTLEAIAELVRDGIVLRVIDHDDGSDRTEEILAQALGGQDGQNVSSDGSDLLTELLRAPAAAAIGLADLLSKAARGSSSTHEEPEPPQVDGAEAESEEAEADEADESRDAEIRELRDQVSQLTDAVMLLLKDKQADLEQE